MGYDISVTTDTTCRSMNWLRNPIGLLHFAEDNVGEPGTPLHRVLNEHAYDDSHKLDREELVRLTTLYLDRLAHLPEAFFYFTDEDNFVRFYTSHGDFPLPENWGTERVWGRPGCAGCRGGKGVVCPRHGRAGYGVPCSIFMPNDGFMRVRMHEAGGVFGHYLSWFEELHLLAVFARRHPDARIRIRN